MTLDDKESGEAKSDLRQKAERLFRDRYSHAQESSFSPGEVLQELQVHQIELEIQNEELHRTQVELQKSRDSFSDLFDFAPIGYVTLDQDDRIRAANQAFCKMIGTDRPKLLRTEFSRYISPTNTKTLYFCLKQAYETAELTGCEVEMCRQDGSILTAELRIESKAVVDDQPRGCRIAIMDVTERKKSENALRESEQEFQSLAENSPNMIFINTKGRVKYANQKCVDITGYTTEELCSPSFSFITLIASEDRDQIMRAFQKHLTGENSRPTEYTLITKQGNRLNTILSTTLIEYKGERSILGINTDITELKQSEKNAQRLREKAEMSSRLAAMGEMAAGIAHEINNPLTGVIGFSELLMERTDLPDDVREDLKIINDGSQRVKEIVKRMLTFARQTKPQKNAVNISELLDNTIELRRYVLRTANIEVVKDYALDLPWVSVDAGQLQQVFLNIIVNAEYAMKKGSDKGVLTVKTEAIDGNVRISISDNGPGMSSKIMAKLFQPFFTTKEPGEGTGLGLSLSHGIILEHRGTIRAESTGGKGATFIIELPVVAVAVEPEAPITDIDTVGAVKQARILVVDDEPTVRGLVKTLLTQQGHTVEECGNSKQVLEKLEDTVFDVILMDLRMPGVSGMELYNEISTRWPKQSKRIIFITGDTSDLATREYLATHQSKCIAKPFEGKTLIGAVVELMSSLSS